MTRVIDPRNYGPPRAGKQQQNVPPSWGPAWAHVLVAMQKWPVSMGAIADHLGIDVRYVHRIVKAMRAHNIPLDTGEVDGTQAVWADREAWEVFYPHRCRAVNYLNRHGWLDPTADKARAAVDADVATWTPLDEKA